MQSDEEKVNQRSEMERWTRNAGRNSERRRCPDASGGLRTPFLRAWVQLCGGGHKDWNLARKGLRNKSCGRFGETHAISAMASSSRDVRGEQRSRGLQMHWTRVTQGAGEAVRTKHERLEPIFRELQLSLIIYKNQHTSSPKLVCSSRIVTDDYFVTKPQSITALRKYFLQLLTTVSGISNMLNIPTPATLYRIAILFDTPLLDPS